MNLEELKQRHQQLSAQRKHFEGQFMMLNGHIAEVEYHITLLERPVHPEPEAVQDERPVESVEA